MTDELFPCDHCGGKLVQRDDDRPESIQTRMHAYAESTRPLTDYYARGGYLVAVSASGTPEEILTRSLYSLKERFAKASMNGKS